MVARSLVQSIARNVASSAAGSAAGSSPVFPITGWQFRTKASESYTDDGTTRATTLGDLVKQLNDLEGSNHVTQATADNRLIFVPSCAIANRPAIRSIHLRDCRLIAPSVSINARDFSFYVIFRAVLTGEDSYGLFNFGSTVALNTPMIDISAGLARTYNPLNSTTNQFIYGNPMVITVTGGASAVSVYRNAIKETLAAYDAATVSGGSLFYRGDGYRFKGADIYEFGLIDSVLTDGDVDLIVAYAAAEYGLRTSWSHFFGITGDSLTEGEYDDGTARDIGRMMGDYLGRSWKLANAGVSGLRSDVINTRAAYALDKQVVGISGRKVCVFLGGTNDLGADALPATTLESRVSTFITDRTSAGFDEIYIGTITERDDVAWSGAKETERLAYNTWVRAQAGSLFTDVVDLDALPEFSDPNDTDYYRPDKLHWVQAARNAALAEIKTVIGV